MANTKWAWVGFFAGAPFVAAVPFMLHGWELGPLQLVQASAAVVAWGFLSWMNLQAERQTQPIARPYGETEGRIGPAMYFIETENGLFVSLDQDGKPLE